MTAQELKHARARRNMNQRQFAKFLGISYSAVTKMETGKLTVSKLAEEKLKDNRKDFLAKNLTSSDLADLERIAALKGYTADQLGVEVIRAFLALAASRPGE